MGSEIVLNAEQQRALDLAMSGCNLFISGDAGTGKSTLINSIVQSLDENNKELMIVAPTGIAAINIDGVTIHRGFKVPLKPLITKPTQVAKELVDADVVICDEVSMCRIDLFEYMIYQIMCANKKRRSFNKKDIQLIFVADFFQLPPVITDRDKLILEEIYDNLGKGYAFQSKYWDACNFKYVVLHDIVRQADKEFSNALTLARRGDRRSLAYFIKNSRKEPIKDAITICGVNKLAETINATELCKIDAKGYTFAAEIIDEVKDSDKIVPEILNLKVGARVMSVINDTEDDYQNGSLGTISKIICAGKNGKANSNDRIVVDFDNGSQAVIYRNTWKIKAYTCKNGKIEEQVIGSYVQFPLKLAYAITIHKSQGQTYDKVNIYPKCWDCGQLYVALSRCRSVENMYFMEDIKPLYLKASDEVINFYRKIDGKF